MAKKSLRHVEGLVKEILEGKEIAALLKEALHAVLAEIMEAEVSEQIRAGYPRAEPATGNSPKRV